MPDHAAAVMADGHASAWPGSIFAQLCLVWSTSMQVGHLADHSGSPQHADTENKLVQSATDSETCGWALMNMTNSKHRPCSQVLNIICLNCELLFTVGWFFIPIMASASDSSAVL